MNAHVIRAIFRRNFVSYFSNPTGYVFICVFVLLSSFAAFWPVEFFNANLANLDQLNKYLPYILLVFVPAITMSIWADERRQGTDELLLTIPATDFDVVLGKYLAAVAIFSVSLVFSLFSNLAVLSTLGQPDIGLLLGTYFGYWVVGLAMLSIGMVASFLTGNLTVGFILGAVFNAPLAFAAAAPDWASVVRKWSLVEQFRDFGTGVISLSGVFYYFSIVALMLYLSMILIGRRHWRGGFEGRAVAGHYLVRFLSLLLALFCLNMFLSHHDRLRMDVTVEKLSSLSPKTRDLVRNLDAKHPVLIEAYISGSVPEAYVPTKLNLISALREFEALGGDRIQVTLHEKMEPFCDEAPRAEKQFGIKPQMVEARVRGARSQEEIFLGVAFSCGLDKVVIPFFSRGIPVEYELVRSIATVSKEKRKKIGVVTTDAKLFGGFDMTGMTREELLIDELKKQYDVVQVDASSPIDDRYDVLLAVQPSTLGPVQMTNFVAAVKRGQPTAIFEDPLPVMAGDVAGTRAPKQPHGSTPFMPSPPPQPKGDINQLWNLLGVDYTGEDVVWQDYNPYQAKANFQPEFVFVGPAVGSNAFNSQEVISKDLQLLLFPFPGWLSRRPSSTLSFKELVKTGEKTGTVKWNEVIEQSFMGPPRINPELKNIARRTNARYVLAAHITGKPKPDDVTNTSNLPMSDKSPESSTSDDAAKGDPGKDDAAHETAAQDKPALDQAVGGKSAAAKGAADKQAEHEKEPRPINAVVVCDIDCLNSAFFGLRARGTDMDDEFNFDVDNVSFILNILDVLAGDERFVDVRSRRPAHRELTRITDAKEKAQERVDDVRENATKKFESAKADAQKAMEKKVAELKKRPGMNRELALTELALVQDREQPILQTKIEQAKREHDDAIRKVENELAVEVRSWQDWYKLWAVLVPPIPPLLVGCWVFFNRRAREREGVSKSRLR